MNQLQTQKRLCKILAYMVCAKTMQNLRTPKFGLRIQAKTSGFYDCSVTLLSNPGRKPAYIYHTSLSSLLNVFSQITQKLSWLSANKRGQPSRLFEARPVDLASWANTFTCQLFEVHQWFLMPTTFSIHCTNKFLTVYRNNALKVSASESSQSKNIVAKRIAEVFHFFIFYF